MGCKRQYKSYKYNMKILNKTYKFVIIPSKEQEVLLSKHFGCSRWVYNYFLNESKTQYKLNKKSDNYYQQAALLTQLKKDKQFEWLKEVNSQTLQQSLKCLETSYKRFFKKISKHPQFKSRKSKNSFTVPQFCTVKDDKIFIPKFKEGIKIIKHREVEGNICKMVITKSPSGKYMVSITTEQTIKKLPKTGLKVGIDLGLKSFIVTSDNKEYKNNKYTKKYEKKLKKYQQHLARKKKGSSGFEKQRLKVAKVHAKMSNSRLDNLHKVSKEIVETYDFIVLEDLNVKGMVKNRRLSKAISDVGWSKFCSLLKYKCEWYQKEIVLIGRYFPSSKMCSSCGWIHKDLKLSDREWCCESCGLTHDRDYNAAINILKEGIRLISVGTTDYTDEDDKGSKWNQKSMKSEAQPIAKGVGG